MCYIIRLEDGSFIIVDGGVDTTKERYEDRIYNILKKQAPDPDNIVIAAWLFSHAHDDHVDIFEYFCESYADKVTVERFIYNLPSSEQASAANDKWDRSAKVREWMDEYFPDVPKTKAHPGQTFYIRNAKIDILYTLDVYESALTDFNNSSVVFAVEAEGQKMMFLGDYMDEGKTLMSLYSAQTLKSDIVQITHHGIGGRGGAINNLYKAIAPTYAFWPGLRIYEHNTYRDLYNEAENQYIVKNSEIFMAEDNVHVFTVKDCTVEVYDTVAAYLAS